MLPKTILFRDGALIFPRLFYYLPLKNFLYPPSPPPFQKENYKTVISHLNLYYRFLTSRAWLKADNLPKRINKKNILKPSFYVSFYVLSKKKRNEKQE